jgi:hypothetical protein
MNMMTQAPSTMSALSIINGDSFDRALKLAELMSQGRISCPEHLRARPADCMAIVMQSMQWGLNPYAVAAETYQDQSGKIGYQAKVVNAVIIAQAPITGRPTYEYIGDWDKILGRVVERENAAKGTKFFARNWQDSDEIGLGVICRYQLDGEDTQREAKLMLSQCHPRFSTQWVIDPKQQIAYAIIKKIGRREFPELMLGIYTKDELDDAHEEIEINPHTPGTGQATQPEAPRAEEPAQSALPFLSEDFFNKKFDKWKRDIENQKTTAAMWEEFIAAQSFQPTTEQLEKIRSIKTIIQGEVLPNE